jgi:hypothetical protein
MSPERLSIFSSSIPVILFIRKESTSPPSIKSQHAPTVPKNSSPTNMGRQF